MKNEEVVSFALKEGADLVGIVRNEELIPAYPWRSPKGILPEVQSIIILAMKLSDAALDSPIMRTSMMDTLATYNELTRIAYRLSRFLEKKGFLAAMIHPNYPVEMSQETRGLVGDLSLRHAAASAGMGFIGKNNLLITPEYGPRVRLAVIIAGAYSKSDARPLDSNCGDCSICIDKCPAKAVSSGGVDIRRCIKVVGGPAGLNAIIKFLIELTDKPKEEIKKMIRSPAFWGFHQALLVGVFYDCHSCMSSCPRGKKKYG